MARLFLYIVLALLLGAGMYVVFKDDPGYVLVAFRGWTFEATLGVAFLVLLALIFFGFSCLWLLMLLNPLKLLRRDTWRGFLHSGSPEDASAQGMQELLLGRWQEAYRLLVENAEHVGNPQANYLAAALAASGRGDELGWRYSLGQAEKKAGQHNRGIKLLKAMLAWRAGHMREAQALLQAIKRTGPESPAVLLQLKEIYARLPDWEALGNILPELEKQRLVTEDEARSLGESVHQWRLDRATREGLESLHAAWHAVPKSLRDSETLVHRYLQYLLQHGQDADAGNVLTHFLKHQWSDSLLRLVGWLEATDPQHLLLPLENMLKERPNNPVLMLTLGRLSLRNQLWGKARDYFDHALRSAKSPELIAEISAELARLLEHLGEEEKSLASYQHAIQMMEHKLPDLPMPVPQR